jgi:hypothetical protein
MDNQGQRILQFCKEFGSITAWQAMKELGIMRLASRIHEMRERYNIIDEWVDDVNRYGDKIRYKRYVILGELNVEKI